MRISVFEFSFIRTFNLKILNTFSKCHQCDAPASLSPGVPSSARRGKKKTGDTIKCAENYSGTLTLACAGDGSAWTVSSGRCEKQVLIENF